MTYGGFLLLFLLLPIGLLLALGPRPGRGQWPHLVGLSLIALIYTTPWDNYLVANRIWWYAPQRVWGVTLAYVPLEEYAFFALQPLLTGLLLLTLRARANGGEAAAASLGPKGLRVGPTAALAGLWVGSLVGLLSPSRPELRYLSLELAWALPPLMLQAAFGADLIAGRLRTAGIAWLGATLYLLVADVVAIRAGIWTIDPAQTLGWDPFEGVVFEEAIFFALTNALIIGGLSLLEDPRSILRLRRWRRRIASLAGRPASP